MPSSSTVERIYSQVFGLYRVAVLTRVSPTQRRLDLYEPSSLCELLVRIIEIAAAAEPEFLCRLLEIDDRKWQQSKKRERRYFAESPELLYISNPGLTHYSKLVAGIWMATNIGREEALTMLGELRQASGVSFELWSVLGIDGPARPLRTPAVAATTTTRLQ